MKKEKMIADQLQFMFLEGKLKGFKEDYVNHVTKQLITGEIQLSDLLHDHSKLKDKIVEAHRQLTALNIFKSLPW